ncbi:MAG: hypothetical protein KH415_17330 [Clostridium sp.]|nr:hypothetical protein [Clostridium sp.]
MSTYDYAIQIINGIPTEIEASDCTVNDLNNEFFCPTPGCTAKLKLCSLNGFYKPYFKKDKETTHSSFCFIKSNNLKRNLVDPSTFNPKNLYDKTLLNPTEKTSSNTSPYSKDKNSKKNNLINLNKLSTTYYYLKSYPIYKKVNGFFIKDLLADIRTSNIYSKVIYDLRIVECVILSFTNNIIKVGYPINSPHLKLNLQFSNNDDFKFILDKCRDKNTGNIIPFSISKPIIVVIADWNNFTGIIHSRKQIMFPKV